MTMVHPVDPHHFVRASSTVSGCLAKAFAKNSKPKDFHDIVQTSLHTYANVFTHICRHLYTHTLTSLAKLPSTLSQSTANGTTPFSWSMSPCLDSARSI
jgi:hypothetical protein